MPGEAPGRGPGEPYRRRPGRIAADSEDLGRGLGQLVVALLELVRDLLERQAIRRVEGGDLTAEETERLGQALLALEDRFAELRDTFDVEPGGLQLPITVDDLLADPGHDHPADSPDPADRRNPPQSSRRQPAKPTRRPPSDSAGKRYPPTGRRNHQSNRTQHQGEPFT